LYSDLPVIVISVVFLWAEALQQADPPCKATYGESNRLITSDLTIRQLQPLGMVCESKCKKRDIKVIFWLSKPALPPSLANNLI